MVLSIFLLQSLFLFVNNVKNVGGVQDDLNLEVALHAELESNSTEIQSSLMPLGTYSFFETPNLDTGAFSHDLTKIEVSNIQYSNENQTTPVLGNLTGLAGNQTINSSAISEYTVSAPKDTIIKANIIYETNVSWSYTGLHFNVSSEDRRPEGIAFDGTYLWVSGWVSDEVYQYTTEGTYTGVSFDTGSEDWRTGGIAFDGTYFWVVKGPEEVYKYTSEGTYTGFHFDVSSEDTYPIGITFDGMYLWITGITNDAVYQYTTGGTYTGVTFSTMAEMSHPSGITFDGTHLWVVSDNRYYQYTISGTYTGAYFDLVETSNQNAITWDGSHFWIVGSANDEVYKFYKNDDVDYYENNFIPNVYVNNFTYQILGINYTESFQLYFEVLELFNDIVNESGRLVYYFGSSDFSHYNYTNDLTIFAQNLTLIIDINSNPWITFDFNLTVLYSVNSWKIPSEINLQINNNDVVDESYNSGYVYLDIFPETLSITSDSANIFFVLNITTDFVFSFNLDVISKTYLSKSFKLLSDHIISINRIELPNDLNIKKIYLNTLDLGDDNPNFLYPPVSMNTNSIYSIEVILVEDIYLPLNDADSEILFTETFSSEQSYMNHTYFPNDYNSTYSVNNGLSMYNEFPNELYTENWTTFNLDYNSSYTNSTFNSWNLSSALNTYSNSIFPLQPNNFSLEKGFSNFLGDLNLINSNYTQFNSTEEGNYNATYSFEGDAVGAKPAGWQWNLEGPSSTIQVISDLDGHAKVAEFNDASDVGRYKWNQIWSDQTTDCIIEFWHRATDYNAKVLDFYIKDDGNVMMRAQFGGGTSSYTIWDGTTPIDLYGPTVNTWYRHKIEFNIVAETFDYSIYNEAEVRVAFGDDYDFNDPYIDGIDQWWMRSDWGDTGFIHYFEAIDYSWTAGYSEGRIINPIPSEINFTSYIQLDNSKIYSNDTLDLIELLYSYKTDIPQQTNISLYNFDSNQFTLINSSINNNGFYPCSFTLNQSYYNSTYDIIIRFELENATNYFELYLDQLKVQYNWTTTSGSIYASIQKSINYTILNYYDSFTNYQKIFNVSIDFSYTFSNYTNYTYLAKLAYDTTTFNLNVSGNWYNFSQSFIFNSSTANSFDLTFNITNGLLELNNLNYSIWFKCLDLENRTKLYQYFKLEPQLETLDWYEKTHSRMILNISYVFTNTSYLVDYNNSIDFSYLLFKINVLSESGWVFSSYSYNNSKTDTLSVNLYQILSSNSKSQFYNFSLEIYISGNNSQVTISDLDLYNKFEITSIQLTENPRTDVNSVDFLEFYQSNRSFSYWYYENQSQLNDLYLIHKRTSTTISSFVNTSNDRYYFQQSSQTNDLFEVYPDYKPNWQISNNTIENTKTTTKIKVDYSADLDISGVSLVLTFTRGDIFETLELNQNQSQTLITLIVPNIDFTTETQSLNLTGVRTQKTTNPHVNYDSVEFNELYYYGDLLLNSYIIDVNPNWDVIHSVVSNTGIYSLVKLSYKADLPIENVNISINLKNDGCYNENWTLGSAQTIDYLLTIPSINFTAAVQILFVEGSSSIPYINISSYESDQNFNRITTDNEIDFVGFLTYTKYTQVFGLIINSSWTAYNVYYGNETYAVESLSNTSIKVLGSGFDPEITDSYLHFTMKPFVYVDWEYKNDIITITINSTMDVDNAFFLYQFDPSGVHTLELQSSDITINDLSDSGDSDGYLTFNTPRVPKGITIITIEVNFATPLEMLIQSIIIFSVCGILIGVFYYLKSNEKARKKIIGFLDKKVLSKLNKAREEKGVNEIVLEIKNNKIHLKKK